MAEGKLFYVTCQKCGKEGPLGDTIEIAEGLAKDANWFIGPDVKKCPACAWVKALNV